MAQRVADAGRALDRRARDHEVAHVAVDGALRHLELLREPASGARSPSPAEQLDDAEEPIGAAHGVAMVCACSPTR